MHAVQLDDIEGSAADPVETLATSERLHRLLARLLPADREAALALICGCDGATARSASAHARRQARYRIRQAARALDAEDSPESLQQQPHATEIVSMNQTAKYRTLLTRARSGLEDDLDGPEDGPGTAAARLDFLQRLRVELGDGGFEALCRAASRGLGAAERDRLSQIAREIAAASR